MNEAECKPRTTAVCTLTPPAAASGAPERARADNPKWEFLSADRSGSRRSARSPSTRTTRATRSRSARARPTRPATPARGRRHLQVDERRRHLDGPDRRRVFQRKRSRHDRRPARHPNTLYAGSTRAVRGISSVSARRVSRSSRGCEVGPLQVDGRRRELDLHPQRRRPTTAAARRPDRVDNGAVCSPRGVRDVDVRPVEPGRSSTRRRTRAGLALAPTRARLDADQAVAQRGPEHDPAGDRRHDAAGRQDPHVRARGQRGAPYSRLFRSDDVATGAPVFTDLTSANPAERRLRDVQRLRGRSAGTTSSSTRPRAIPDIVYVGGSYSYGETFGNQGRGVILSTDAGVTSHGHDDGRDRLAPPERAPSRPALLVTVPDAPFQFIEANDGGVMRSNGTFSGRLGLLRQPRGLTGAALAPLQADALAGPGAAGVDQQRPADAAVPEPLGEPAQRRHAPGRDAGQRHVGEPRARCCGRTR